MFYVLFSNPIITFQNKMNLLVSCYTCFSERHNFIINKFSCWKRNVISRIIHNKSPFMRKPPFCIAKGTLSLAVTAKLISAFCFHYKDSKVIKNFQPLTIFCACTAWFVLDLFKNHIVGFHKSRLICMGL